MTAPLREHEQAICRGCGKLFPRLNPAKVSCSPACASRVRYHARYPQARTNGSAPKTYDAVPAHVEAKIEATRAAWEAYYRATRRYRITDGWEGYHIRFER